MSEPVSSHHHEVSHAFRNALKLAGSLVLSFGITLAVRHFIVPRTLGAERFGELNFADGFAGLFMVATCLGVDTWLRTELGVTLKRADGIFGGALLVRAGLGIVLTGAMVVVLLISGRPSEIIITACVFAISQWLVMSQSTASALLHAAGKVDGLSVVNVVTKVMWASTVVVCLVFRFSIIWIATAYTASEGFRLLGTLWLCRKHAGLTATVDWPQTRMAMKASLSWWINGIALAGMGRADVAVLGSVAVAQLGSQAAANREVGWYTAILGIGGILMAVVPVINWVLLPPLSKAAKESAEKAAPIIRRALEACVVIGAPLAVGGFVAAEPLVLLLKPEFLPAAKVMEVMSPTYLFTYLNVVAATCLAALNRGWSVTLLSLAMLVVTPTLDFLLVPPLLQHFGPSGGAIACGVGLLVTEVVTTAIMISRLGSLAFDRRLVFVCVRTVATAAIVLGINYASRQIGVHGWLRVALVAMSWVMVALATRAVLLSDIKSMVKMARAQRSGATV